MHYQKPSFSCLIHPALILLLIVTSVSVIAQAAQQETDGDSSAVFELVDTPYGPVMAASDIPVTLRDDVVLSLDIYLPESGERFSTLYAAGPYPHNQTILTDPNAEAGPIAWFASQGYAVVLASLRGTGLSGGDYGFLALEEQQDHYEIVEWIAGQPWSDGQVAGTGAGYYAAAQWQMAIQNPPHLSCIAPINGVTDPLREWVYPGGLANHEFINDWYDRRVRLANAYSQEAPRLVSLDLRLSQLANPGAGEFWQIRSSMGLINQIDVPVFVLFNWSQRLQQPSLALTIDALEQLNVTSKILITNPPENASLQQDIPLLATELLPFYEWCFNERSPDASFVERPRIRFQVRGQNATRPDSNWPPGNIEHKAWFLNPAGTDEYGALEQTRADSLAFTPMPAGNTDNTLRFISRRLTEDLELTGPVMLELYASTSGTDMAFKATLSEELIYQAITTTPLFPSFTTPDLPDNAMAEKSTLVTVTPVSSRHLRERDLQDQAVSLPRCTRFRKKSLFPVARLPAWILPSNKLPTVLVPATDSSWNWKLCMMPPSPTQVMASSFITAQQILPVYGCQQLERLHRPGILTECALPLHRTGAFRQPHRHLNFLTGKRLKK